MKKNPGNASSLSLTGEKLVGTTSRFNPIFEGLVEWVVTLSANALDLGKHSMVLFKLGFIGGNLGAKSDAGQNRKKLNRIIHECGGWFKLAESSQAPLSNTMNSVV
ncbi:hypothetical protein J1N35_019280 [Gossypium stocksii]|uniref:Uncharacterized protein n=1 Tax=Gossypium stocksii TaxID=47602 RepID=A0A9D3VS95_9ROSI|nr:hypothetical protein J1N35_019280 [Gossypium stocksii]